MESVLQEVRIEQLCLRVTTGATPLRSRSDFYEGGTTDWYKTGELKDWYLEPAEERITEKALQETSVKLFPANTVLMAMYGDGRTITSLGMLRAPAATNQACAAMLVDEEKCDPRYFFYALKSRRHLLLKVASGGAQRNLSGKLIKEFKLPLYRLPTQRRIAGILSAYDELIENSQRRIKILEAKARALYREWFVHFRFPGHESVPRVPSSLGEIPQGWEVKPFSEIASYINGYPFKPAQLGVEGKPIIKIKELKAGIVADTPRNFGDGIPEKYTVYDGCVLFSWSAHLDAYLWKGGEGLLNQHLFNVVPFEGISRAFLFHSLKESMPRFRALSLGATMHHIKRSALDQVFALFPPAGLRKLFEILVEPMHQQLITLTKHLDNLGRTRDLLLPRLLSGQIDVDAMPS